jgi:hypothetical protein
MTAQGGAPAATSANHYSNSARNTLKLVMMGLLVILGIAIVALLGVNTRYVVIDHRKAAEAAAEAKKSEIDKRVLAVQVTDGIQRIIDGDDSLKGYRIQLLHDLSLFQVSKGGTEYRGLVTAQVLRGTTVPLEVTAYADPSGLMYEIDGGSEVRLHQAARKEQPEVCANSC